ncbi:unnamed protein product, partial [Ectocarpus sp. 4 AP-2014]
MYASHFTAEPARGESTSEVSSMLPLSNAAAAAASSTSASRVPELDWARHQLQQQQQQQQQQQSSWPAPSNLAGWRADGLASSNGPAAPAVATGNSSNSSVSPSRLPAAGHSSNACERALSPHVEMAALQPAPPARAPSPFSPIVGAPRPAGELTPSAPDQGTATAGGGGGAFADDASLNRSGAAAAAATYSSAQQQEEGGASTPPPRESKSPSVSPGATTSPGGSSSASRTTPKKKPRSVKKKKPKVGAAADGPVRRRRVVKVKKARPPEVGLGERGRERSMDILRLLAGSPLSEEFRKPVVLLHPELAERYTVEVRRPIDLTTVARRVRRGTYDNSAGRLRRDIARIFTNCERFNMCSGQLFVGIARHLRALFESKWAESDLPYPGESQATSHRRRAALRTARYRLCWRAQLRGPLREAARQAVRAASAAALAAGDPSANGVSREFSEDILPMLSGEGEESNEEWTLGLFAERACLALGLRANQPPPLEEACPGGGGGAAAAAAAAGEKAGRDACADWLFGPRQAAWLAAETAPAREKRDPASAPPPVATAAVVSAAWRALDDALSPATVLVASNAARGTPFSSVWARPDKLVWAKQAKNTFWPAMLLWGSGTTAALKEVNMGRVPPAFREELEKQAKGTKGNNRNGAVVEFFGLHEFALLKPDALRPLSTLDKSPNKTVSKNKRWDPTMEEARKAVVNLRDLETTMYMPQPEPAAGLNGFTMEPSSEELHQTGTPASDTDTSSGESTLESDTESNADLASPPTAECSSSSCSSSSSPFPAPSCTAAVAGSASSVGGPHRDSLGGGRAPPSLTAMSPPPPPSRASPPPPATAATAGGAGGLNAAGGGKGRSGGLPAWRLALKRPLEELTPKERALEKVCRYLDKFGDMFSPQAQLKAAAEARDKDKAAALGGRGHNNAPSAPAAAAVLGQTGLWGSLMGAPVKVEEETESTDGEDE